MPTLFGSCRKCFVTEIAPGPWKHFDREPCGRRRVRWRRGPLRTEQVQGNFMYKERPTSWLSWSQSPCRAIEETRGGGEFRAISYTDP